MKRCEVCGASMVGRRSVAKYCSDVCRARAKRGYRAPTVEPVGPTEPATTDDELLSLEELAREVQRTLRSRETPATAKAGLSREYRAILDEIDQRRTPAADAVDELFERRVRRA